MYARRDRKPLPAGTFIPTPARVMAIIQLCLAFTVLAWNATQPFMGELFSIKSRLLLYQYVMGIKDPNGLLSDSKKLESNAERFHALPEAQKRSIFHGYEQLQKLVERSFWTKLKRSFQILALGLPPFEQAWIAFSIIIPILLLKRMEAIEKVLWILPLLAILYAVDNHWSGLPQWEDPEVHLFPSEKVIIDKYLRKPLSQDIFQQREQLLYGWKIYLIEEWAHETPTRHPDLFEEQAEKGEFTFNLARLDLALRDGSLYTHLHTKEPLFWLGTYFFWNLIFTLIAWKHTRSVRSRLA